MLLRGRAAGRADPTRSRRLKSRPVLLGGEDLLPAATQKRALEKRQRLERAALELFGERGYEGTAIDAIAERADVAVGAFYQHFRSKRQILLVLMDELLEAISRLELTAEGSGNVRTRLRSLLSRAFARDLQYLGAYRAWQEALLSDRDLARKQQRIQEWTSGRVAALLAELQRCPGARRNVDVPAIARVIDSYFWSLLAQAVQLSRPDLNQSLDAATHIIYHAMFEDPVTARRRRS